MNATMQRVVSASSLKDGVGADGSKPDKDDVATGVVEPDKSPVVEVPLGVTPPQHQILPPPPPHNMRTKTTSFTSLLMPQDEPVRRFKRRKADWACELQRIAMFVGVFSLIAWVTYLFLTKDE